jgi:hypothetical protein
MPRITEMFAFVAEDEGPDDEGVIAYRVGDHWLPMVGADMARVDSLRPQAQAIASEIGARVKLLRFTQREEMETLKPA